MGLYREAILSLDFHTVLEEIQCTAEGCEDPGTKRQKLYHPHAYIERTTYLTTAGSLLRPLILSTTEMLKLCH